MNLKHRGPWWPLLVGILAFLLWIGRGRFRHWTLVQLKRVRRGSHRAQTNLGVVEYQLVGTGPPVLLVHGGPGGSDSWRIYQPLLDAGFSLLAPSRPGYLGTPLRRTRTFSQQADLLAALLDELGIEQVAVIGHSMGGPVALALAGRHPSRVRRLVLLSAMTHPNAVIDAVEEVTVGTSWVPQQFQSLLFWVSHRMLHYLPSVAVRTAIWMSYTGPDTQACTDTILASPAQRRLLQATFDGGVPLRQRQRGYDNDIRQLRHMAQRNLQEILTPTLILHSRYDASVPLQHAMFAAAHLPNATLSTVDGCGHLLLVGPQAATIVRTLAGFLNHPDQP